MADEPVARVVTHWLPQPLNEGSVTACGLDVLAHPYIRWLIALNETTCKRCLTSRQDAGDGARQA